MTFINKLTGIVLFLWVTSSSGVVCPQSVACTQEKNPMMCKTSNSAHEWILKTNPLSPIQVGSYQFWRAEADIQQPAFANCYYKLPEGYGSFMYQSTKPLAPDISKGKWQGLKGTLYKCGFGPSFPNQDCPFK